jgi:hypothetical protein
MVEDGEGASDVDRGEEVRDWITPLCAPRRRREWIAPRSGSWDRAEDDKEWIAPRSGSRTFHGSRRGGEGSGSRRRGVDRGPSVCGPWQNRAPEKNVDAYTLLLRSSRDSVSILTILIFSHFKEFKLWK